MARIPPPFGQELIFGIFPPYFVYTVLIILGIALIFHWLLRSARRIESPVEILKKRYAKGEIDRDTFNAMKKELLE